MKHFIAYHKVADLGPYKIKGDEITHFSYRAFGYLEQTIGNAVWVISGEKFKNKSSYSIVSYFIADFIEEDIEFGGYIIGGKGNVLTKPVNIDLSDWRSHFLKAVSNFSLGIVELKNEQLINELQNCTQRISIPSFIKSNQVIDNSYIQVINQVNEKMQNILPEKQLVEINRIIRNDRKIVELLKKAANYKCQFPNCNAEIQTISGSNYVEVAHIKSVKKGGQSILGNLLVLCPNHHAEFDNGRLAIIEQNNKKVKGILNGKVFEISFLR